MKWLKSLLDQPARDNHEDKVRAMVEEFGLHITNVGIGDTDPNLGFSYTSGLPQSVGQPDIIVFGLPLESRANMLLETFDQCRKGLVPADFAEVRGVVPGHRCILREVLPGNFAFNWFYSATMYQEHRTGKQIQRAMQLVWPTTDTGLFPWENGCHWEVCALQTPLYDKVLSI